MGCCFSKELSGDKDNEKTGLLQKSVEEKEPDNKISKALSALFDTLRGEELRSVHRGVSRSAAGANAGTQASAGAGHKEACRAGPSFNSVSSSVYKFLTGYEDLDDTDKNSDTVASEQAGGRVCAPPRVGIDRTPPAFSAGACSDGDECLSYVPGPCDQDIQKGGPVNRQMCHHPITCKDTVTEKEIEVSVQVGRGRGSNALTVSGRKTKGGDPAGVGRKRCRNSSKSEFYSICVVDPDGLDVDDEPFARVRGAAAAEDCHSAVTSEGTCGGAWLPDSTDQGPGALEAPQELLSPRSLPGLHEVKDVSSERAKPLSELLTDSDPACKGSTGDTQAESLRAHTHTRLPKDHVGGRAPSHLGRASDPKTSADPGSPGRVRAVPGRRSHSSVPLCAVGGPRGGLLSNMPRAGRDGESRAAETSGGHSSDSEEEGGKNSVKPLKDRDCSSLEGSGSDRNLPSQSLARVNLSSKRRATSMGLGNECLPVPTNYRGTVSDPRPERLGPMTTEGQLGGDRSLGTGSTQLTSKGEVPLRPEDRLSYRHEDGTGSAEDEGRGQRAFAVQPSSQVGLCAGTGASQALARGCDSTRTPRRAPVEAVGQPADSKGPGAPQAVPQSGASRDSPGCVQSDCVSSAVRFACPEEESNTGPSHKTEGEPCGKGSGSDPHGLEHAGKELLQTKHRETHKNDIKSVRVDSETTLDWESNPLKRKVVPGQDLLACVSSSLTKIPHFETNQIEKRDESHRAKGCGCEELHAPRRQGSSGALVPGAEGAQALASAGGAATSAGHGPELRRGKGTGGLDCEKDSSESGSGPRDARGTSRRARLFKLEGAMATAEGPPLPSEVGSVGSSGLKCREMGLCDTLTGCPCPAGADCARVDRHTAAAQGVLLAVPVTPGDSREIAVTGSEDHVLSLSEDTVDRSEHPSERSSQGSPEALRPHCVHELSCCPGAALASQVFSERLTAGHGCPGGWPWTSTVMGDAPEDEQILDGDLHSQPQDFTFASFWLEKLPYQLPMAEDGVIWGWHNGGAQLVSMFYQFLVCTGIY